MPFLQPTNSSRLKKNATVKGRMLRDRRAADATDAKAVANRDTFDNIDEAVEEHRKSMAGRPKSAGVDKRKRSASKRRVEVEIDGVIEAVQDPRCGDDLQKVGQTIEYTAGLDTFSFPTPSPRMAPRSATLQNGARFPGMPPRSHTYQQSSSPGVNEESPHIGCAIGSPSNAPPSWGRSYTSDHILNRMPHQEQPMIEPPAALEYEEPKKQSIELRKKKSSWKAFGSMFRKSNKRDTEELFYKVDATAQTQTIGVPYSSPRLGEPGRPDTPLSCIRAPSPGPGMFSHSRAPSYQCSPLRLDERYENRTSFMPATKSKMLRSPSKRDNSKSHFPWRASEDIFRTRDQRHDSPLASENAEATATPWTPRLDLDLPPPEFPRYSIMFEKLLTSDPKPSLLERRQSKIHETKSQKRRDFDGTGNLQVRTDGNSGLKRAPTSSHLTRSLSIQVDGNKLTDEPETAVHRPRLRQRSRTAPAGAVSPVAAAFMRQKEAQAESLSESPHSLLSSEASPLSTPVTITTSTDASSVKRVLEDSEPSWDMMSSKTCVASDDLSSHRSARTEPYPRVMSPQDLERQIVQVSVARQVSVSRARNRVQRAANSKTAAQPLRPRVVELTKNRKSTAGVVEDASAEPLPDDAASVIAHSRATSASSQMSFDKSRKTSVSSAAPMPEDAASIVAHSRAASAASQMLLRDTRKVSPAPPDATIARDPPENERAPGQPPQGGWVDIENDDKTPMVEGPVDEEQVDVKAPHTAGENELDTGYIC